MSIVINYKSRYNLPRTVKYLFLHFPNQSYRKKKNKKDRLILYSIKLVSYEKLLYMIFQIL